LKSKRVYIEKDKEFILLDPIYGHLEYKLAYDEEANTYYTTNGWSSLNSEFDQFESELLNQVSIDARKIAEQSFNSEGDTSDALFDDMRDDTTHGDADIVIGVIFDSKNDGVTGLGEQNGDECCVFDAAWTNKNFSPVILHEIGHIYGLSYGGVAHCWNPFCAMYFITGSSNYCGACEAKFDPMKFSYYPMSFEGISIGSLPTDNSWYFNYASPNGVISVQTQSPQDHVLNLYKTGGTSWIYARNYPDYHMSPSDEGTVTFKLKTSTAIILYFYSENGYIKNFFFYHNNIYENSYPGTKVGTYSNNAWYDVEFIYDINDGAYTFKMNSIIIDTGSDLSTSGNFASVLIGSFYSGLYTTGNIYIDNLDFTFES